MKKKDIKRSFYDRARKLYIVDDLFTMSFEHENGVVTLIRLQKNDEKEPIMFKNITEFMHFLSKIDKKPDEYIVIWLWRTTDFTDFFGKNYKLVDEFPRDEKFYRFYQIYENGIIFQSCDKFSPEKPSNLHQFMMAKKEIAGHVASIQMTASRETRKWLLKRIYRETKFENGKVWKDQTLYNWFENLKIESLESFGLLRSAVGAGFNGIAENYREKKVTNAQVWDIISMYISMMITMKFPFRTDEVAPVMSIDEFMKKCDNKTYMGVAWMTIEKLDLRETVDVAPLTVKKEDFPTYLHAGKKKTNHVEQENGQISYADEITIPVTSWDVKWLCRCYRGRAVLTNVEIFECRYLPKFYVNALLELFQAKSQNTNKLKRALSKILANGVSGAWAQLDINYESWKVPNEKFIEGGKEPRWRKMTDDEKKVREQKYLDDYNRTKDDNKRKIQKVGHLTWYVMLMGACRYRVIKAALDIKKFFYGDTDSNMTNGDATDYYENLNQQWVEYLIDNLEGRGIDIVKAYDAKRNRFVGEWECENWDAIKVVKRKVYAKEKDGNIVLKCSGLAAENVEDDKTVAEKYLEEHGGLDAFKERFVFPEEATNRVQRIPLLDGGYILKGDKYIVGITDVLDYNFNK